METMESAISCKNNPAKFPCKNSPQNGDNLSPSHLSETRENDLTIRDGETGGGLLPGTDWAWVAARRVRLDDLAKRLERFNPDFIACVLQYSDATHPCETKRVASDLGWWRRRRSMRLHSLTRTRRSPASPWVSKSDSPLSSIRRIINSSGASPRGHRHGRSVYSSAVCVANATTLSDRFYTPTNAFRRVGLPLHP